MILVWCVSPSCSRGCSGCGGGRGGSSVSSSGSRGRRWSRGSSVCMCVIRSRSSDYSGHCADAHNFMMFVACVRMRLKLVMVTLATSVMARVTVITSVIAVQVVMAVIVVMVVVVVILVMLKT